MNAKRKLLFCVAVFLTAMSWGKPTALLLGEAIPLQVVWSDETIGSPGTQKSPVLPPVVYLDGHSLYFGESYAEAIPVELRDASGNVVYSGYLPAGVQTLALPTTLSGTYTLFIYMGNYIFAGLITL